MRDTLHIGLRHVANHMLAGATAGLDAEAATLEEAMHATTAHGDITGATRAGYSARRVGLGADGAAAHAASVAAVEAHNPGASATAPVAIDGLGVIVDCPTTYQEKLETEQAGRKAVLGPTLSAARLNLTAAAAAGVRNAAR